MRLELHHLTEDEMNEALLGAAAPSRAAHLRTCAQCAASFAEFSATMANFNQASEAWSEAKSNALSRDLQQHQTPFRITSGVLWSCASALMLMVAVMLGLGVQQRSAQTAISQADSRWSHAQSNNSKDASQSEIASDDAMLRQIDAAINNAEPSPEALYGVASTSANVGQTSRQTQGEN